MQTRRTFAALTAGAGFAPGKRPLEQWKPGIKISLQLPGDPSDEDLAFVRQLGLRYVNIPSGGAAATPDNFIRLRQKAEAAGLKVFKSGNRNVHNMPEVTLNLPGRDEKIEEYKQYLRNLASAGICYTTYAHMGNGIWSSQREATPGGALARALDLRKNPKGVWRDKTFEGPLTHGRRYSEREIWDNYEYFIRRITPVAEELGIRIGIHPDDPPGEPLGGVPRCIFSSFEGYRQALEIASNPNLGLCLCCGCRLEGGPRMGKGQRRRSAISPVLANSSKFISAMPARRFLISWKLSWTSATGTCTGSCAARRGRFPRLRHSRSRALHGRLPERGLGVQHRLHEGVSATRFGSGGQRKVTTGFRQAWREHSSITAQAEKRLLVRIARRLPQRVNSGHLTALGFLAMAGAGKECGGRSSDTR